jgi:hypothetical protein
MVPQRGVNALAEWDSVAKIDGSESISPDLIKLRGGWASQDPGRPHACSPFRTLKMACGHCEKEKGCIVVTYLRRICFDMPETSGGGLPHDWFHAMIHLPMNILATMVSLRLVVIRAVVITTARGW